MAIALCRADGSIKQILHTFSNCEIARDQGIYSDAAIPVTITEDLVEGDRIRVVYDGAYSEGWQWARRYKDSSSNEKASGNAAAKQSVSIDMQGYAAGTYTFSFKLGGNPYVLTIKK